jgi:hypothetical protein
MERTQAKTLEDELVIYTGLNNDLRADKENLQKQLEILTLRLPPPGLASGPVCLVKRIGIVNLTFAHLHKRMRFKPITAIAGL